MAADRVGKEAALLMPSGSMANLVALLTYCHRRDEVILGYSTDMYLWEVGAMSAVGGIHPYPLRNQPDGTLELADIQAAIRPDKQCFPRTQLVCLENTNGICGGVPLAPDYTASVCGLAGQYGLPVYVDGARIFNAAVALAVDVKELVKDVDSLMFCLSKGLCCPVGSMLCGSADFIAEARHNRQMLGGQMRQAGIIAAAGIVALEQMVDRLADDHRNACLLGEGLRGIHGLSVMPEVIETNIVFFRLTDDRMTHDELVAKLNEEGVRVLPVGSWLRAVTYCWIGEEDIRAALTVIRGVIEGRQCW
jgi:threonine aldolase